MGAVTPLRPAGGPEPVDRTPTGGADARWADPVEGRGSAGTGGDGGLIGGRYALTAVLRQDDLGGVFLAVDTRTGEDVVVKQARTPRGSGADPRSALREEARLLAQLDSRGIAPQPLRLIEQGDSLLLVQECVPGQALDSWVAARLAGDGTPQVPWAAARPLALALVDLVEQAHAAGVLLCGLAPGAVVVAPDGLPRLQDLAAACSTDTGGADPGGRAADSQAARAAMAADRYALGGLLLLLATGHDPLLAQQPPQARPVPEQPRPARSTGPGLGRWLALATRDGLTARRLAPAVLGLRAEDPARRWQLPEVREALGATPEPSAPPEVTTQPLERAVRDGLRHLAETVTPHRPDRLWPAVPTGRSHDPCTEQREAADLLSVLARASATTGLPPEVRERAARTAATAAAWIERRCAAGPAPRPDPHHARSAPVRALLDAADALGDPALSARAQRLAEHEPWCRPHPSACRGAAGAGRRQLRRWQRTGEQRALDLAVAAGRAVPVDRHGGVTRGCHGPAGDGAFLLDLAEATGDDAFHRAALESAFLLVAHSTLRDGLLVLPEETGTGCPAAYGTGVAGALALLLRLRYGGELLRFDLPRAAVR
ncbi:lanthionine synthetase LanC family protein [Kitasatospora sp. MAP12-22]|uniref:lanthionine synthetase LanC family protein n=1 Tax=unclassified Kitasatospora TaxID=2633591 RepID=UPI0035132EDA